MEAPCTIFIPLFYDILYQTIDPAIKGIDGIWTGRASSRPFQMAATERGPPNGPDSCRISIKHASLQAVSIGLKGIISPVIGFARHRSNIPRNNLASFCGALKEVD